MGKIKKPVNLNEVQVLQILSSTLRLELHYELCYKSMHTHPLFLLCEELDIFVMHKVCFETVKFQTYPPGDQVFHQSDEALAAHFIVRGDARYCKAMHSTAPER